MKNKIFINLIESKNTLNKIFGKFKIEDLSELLNISNTIKLFNSTGFSKENIPDSVELLNSLEYLESEIPTLIQSEFLSEITLNSNYEDIKNCDYCQIGSIYYFITNINILSNYKCKIYLIPDYSTTSKGIIKETAIEL